MQLEGVTIDFSDKRTCGLLPDLCLQWDLRHDELDDNTELVEYWENNLKKVLEKSDKIVSGNLGAKSILYSADSSTINVIKDVFKELKLKTIDYENVIKCEHCLHHDYLNENFKP